MYSGLTLKEFTAMQKYIEEKCGISIGEDKAYLMESRLTGLLAESGLASFEELYQKIIHENNYSVIEKVIDAVATNETFWFRDKTPWYIMEEILLPVYIRELREGKRTCVRIWSAACSSGQEPYSIAICIDNYLMNNGIKDVSLSQFDILATDISNSILQIASLGRFDSISIMRGLDDEYKVKYFENRDRAWIINEKIKNAVHFQQFNLQRDFFNLGSFDIVFCRNVLIYFAEKMKQEVMDKMSLVLDTGGVLFLGSSELFHGYNSRFAIEQYKNGIYYRLKR